jgi:predicted transcriptional regulator
MADASEYVQISLCAPVATVDAFDRIASVLDRDRAWVMLRAFSVYLKVEGAHILAEAEGIAELERGESVDFDATMDQIDKIISDAEQTGGKTDQFPSDRSVTGQFVSPEEAEANLSVLMESARMRAPSGSTSFSSNHDDLYDEFGLPK